MTEVEVIQKIAMKQSELQKKKSEKSLTGLLTREPWKIQSSRNWKAPSGFSAET